MSPEELAILARLRSVEGHLHATIIMLESDRPRDQVLHQLGAVKSALHAAACALARYQAARSLEVIRAKPCEEEQQAELDKLKNIYRWLTDATHSLSS